MCLIVVDDCPDTRLTFLDALRLAGLGDVYTAASGPELFDLLPLTLPTPFSDQVRAILLDVGLPGLDGIEICRSLRTAPHLSHIPILLMTGGGTTELERGFAAGATDFLTKPVVWPHLVARLRALRRWQDDRDWYRTRVRTLEEQLRCLQDMAVASRLEAARDALTGLPNRRSLDAALDQECRRAARSGQPIGVVMVDVDYFKAFNDRYGHQAGDACLARVGHALREALHRPGDVAARYGGEEFTLVLPDTDMAGATAVAEAVRAQVEALAVPHAGRPAPTRVTVSLGVAAAVPGPTMGAELLAAADRALYMAKHEGRNRVAVWRRPVEASDGNAVSSAVELPPPAWTTMLQRVHETSQRIESQVQALLSTAPPSDT
ncbi:MAG: diguanylate cyclase [Gemmataceae bacterium]